MAFEASPRRLAGPARRTNWGWRTLAALGALAAFVGLWQAAAHETARNALRGQGSGATNYAPPGGGTGGVFAPGNFPRSPDTSTHVS